MRDRRPLRRHHEDGECVGQELNLHSRRRAGYSRLGSPMPSRHILRKDETGRMKKALLGSSFRLLPSSLFQSGSGGTRTHSISRSEREWSARLPTEPKSVDESGLIHPSSFRLHPSEAECPAGVEPACPAWEAGAWAARPRARVLRVGMAGFEPAISSVRVRRELQASPHPEGQSTQRELNPHIRHGKAVGYRYIMGA